MVDVPVRIHWSCGARSGVAEYQAIATVEDGLFCLSEYYWTEGNYGCDCNRVSAIGMTPVDFPDLFVGGDPGEPRCGGKIAISRIESLDPLIPSLDLGEVPDATHPG
jgi:hypothetical protein